MNWLQQCKLLLEANEPLVLVTVAGIRGSSPRELGAKMIVTRHATLGSIGGGRLEFESIEQAREKLTERDHLSVRRFPLGPSLGQCCGGVVDVLLEQLQVPPTWLIELTDEMPAAGLLASDLKTGEKQIIRQHCDDANAATGLSQRAARVVRECLATQSGARLGDRLYEYVGERSLAISVFGAGHVGKRLVALLSTVSGKVRWIDNRVDMFTSVAGNVEVIHSADPVAEVRNAPAGSYFVVLTHDHQLDFALCDQILKRGDASFVGVIGSLTKRRRFEKRFRALGVSEQLIEQLVCPIGLPELKGKAPEEIAISVVADILKRRDEQVSQSRLENPVALSVIGA